MYTESVPNAFSDKEERLMKRLIERFSGLVNGVLTGFDRIVFKGFILPLMSTFEGMGFWHSKNILNKNYKDWMMAQTKSIVTTADQYSKDHCGWPVTYIPTWQIREEELAHEQQQKEQISSGLIGVWACQERASKSVEPVTKTTVQAQQP